MISLQPTQAAHFANIAYATLKQGGLKTSASYPYLSPLFNFDNYNITGISGSILERIFRHQTPFGYIAKGRTGGV
ncbi:hypothetical protein [Pseudoalteromonas sp. 68 DY56-GL68]|uniref:hypothetical protein n=1 Tax=Pseudoalteromonas sp. 68 DY56-GL68 TaxID=2974919 RepID=UPI00352A5A3E